MTLYYDEEQDALIENSPDQYVSYDDEGNMVFDLSDEYGAKSQSLYQAAKRAMGIRD